MEAQKAVPIWPVLSNLDVVCEFRKQASHDRALDGIGCSELLPDFGKGNHHSSSPS
jgi:hypothetical protein